MEKNIEKPEISAAISLRDRMRLGMESKKLNGTKVRAEFYALCLHSKA